MSPKTMTFTQAVKQSGFNTAQLALLRLAAWQTWEDIAHDVLAAREECGERGDMPRSHVLEVVLDADYMRRRIKPADVATYEAFLQLTYAGRIALVKAAFPHARYG